MQPILNVDILTLNTGHYYATNCTNLPIGWVAAYLDVERLDDLWCRITAWPPYVGLDSPQIIKQTGGDWQGWKTVLTNADIHLFGTSNVDVLFNSNTDDCVFKWIINDGLHYQLVAGPGGISYDRWDGTAWNNVWRK